MTRSCIRQQCTTCSICPQVYSARAGTNSPLALVLLSLCFSARFTSKLGVPREQIFLASKLSLGLGIIGTPVVDMLGRLSRKLCSWPTDLDLSPGSRDAYPLGAMRAIQQHLSYIPCMIMAPYFDSERVEPVQHVEETCTRARRTSERDQSVRLTACKAAKALWTGLHRPLPAERSEQRPHAASRLHTSGLE